MFVKIRTAAALILVISLSLGINCSTLVELPIINDFFLPDDDTYKTMQLPFEEGLKYIQQIPGSKEEIFIAFPSSCSDLMIFVDIGYNALSSLHDTCVFYNITRLIEYVIKKGYPSCIYFIHNHPHDGLSPPSFQDFFTLSNLKKEFTSCNIDSDIIGLVASKNGIWKYDTTEKLEAELFNEYRNAEQKQSQHKDYLSFRFYFYAQDWADLAKNLEKKPEILMKEMEKKGVLLEYYSTCSEYTNTLIHGNK